MCLVGFKSREKEFSLFSVRSDGDIEDDDAIAVAIEMVIQAAVENQSKCHTTASLRLLLTP